MKSNKEKLIKTLNWLLHDLKTEPITVGGHALRSQYLENCIEQAEQLNSAGRKFKMGSSVKKGSNSTSPFCGSSKIS